MAEIAAAGGISVHDYMQRSNAHYYATRDPLGAAGDFTTAPEISQMFGELIGAWAADLWLRAGTPTPLRLVELGPGRGTLMRDLLRAAGQVPGFAEAAEVHMVETSPVLRRAQAAAVPSAVHHDGIADVPTGAPTLFIANEFLDALPVQQQVETAAGWQERMVMAQEGGTLAFTPAGDRIRERACAAEALVGEVAARLAADGGAALFIDYGYAGGEEGDTLQAVRAHETVDPLACPGEADVTVHVDFAAVARAAELAGCRAHGPVSQVAFLSSLGLGLRAETLMRGKDEAARTAVAEAARRLSAPDAMGALFKVLGIAAPDWPAPGGLPEESQ
nr:SAM-dependent methyltransferase [Pacificimonas flava]